MNYTKHNEYGNKYGPWFKKFPNFVDETHVTKMIYMKPLLQWLAHNMYSKILLERNT